MKEYLKINQNFWDSRVASHLESDFYDLAGFLAGASSLKPIETEWLGPVAGLDLLHLQCHFGQDTLCLAREGARVTGVDLSPQAVEQARKLARQLEIDAEFICCDVFDTLDHLQRRYDRVFTSYGTIGWLPELGPWARVIQQALRPGGRFLIVEFHPVIWIFDDQFKEIVYSYFNRGPIVEEAEGSYAAPDAPIKSTLCGWNHSLADVISSLQAVGMEITRFGEFDASPWDCFQNTVAAEKGFQIKGLEGKIPMVYALEARRPE